MIYPSKPTPHGVLSALQAATKTVLELGEAWRGASDRFARFDDAARYSSLAESCDVVAAVLNKLDADSIAADGPVLIVLKKEFDQLVAHSVTLAKLRAAGVDNWEGYDHALRSNDD